MNIIFDLDGTISDSSQGIIDTFRTVFAHYGLPEISEDTIKKYIGPPTEETFARYLPQEEIPDAVSFYRKVYNESGIMENKMYPRIDRLLQHLRRQGHKTYVATTKEVNAAKQILKNFDIFDSFDGVYGVNTAEGIFTKTDVLHRLFEETAADKADSILVGDTVYDVDGAAAAGIKVAIVLYGFGTKQSFGDKKVDFFVDTVDELFDLFD